MQSIYALTQAKEDSLEKQLKFLNVSIANVYTLYLLQLGFLVELRQLAEKYVSHASKKYLEDKQDHYPNKERFVQNRILLQVANNALVQKELSKRKLNDWYLNEDYVKIIHKEVIGSDLYHNYMASKTNGYTEDRELVMEVFKTVIAPNEKIYDYFEDEKLTWADDIPIVNTFLVKRLKKVKPDSPDSFLLPRLLKDEQDMVFAKIAYW